MAAHCCTVHSVSHSRSYTCPMQLGPLFHGCLAISLRSCLAQPWF